MYCEKCGTKIADSAVICPVCKTPQNVNFGENYNPYVYTQPENNNTGTYNPNTNYNYTQNTTQQTYYNQQQFNSNLEFTINNDKVNSAKNMGIASLILAFFIPLASIIVGALGISKINSIPFNMYYESEKNSARKFCNAGIIISVISFVLIIIFVLLYFVFFGLAFSDVFGLY